MDSTDAPLSDGPVTSTVEISNNVEWREQVREQVTDSTTDQIAFENPHIKVRGYTELRNHQSPDDIEAPKEKCRIPSWWETPTSFETHQKNITGAEYTDAMHSVWNRRQSHLTYYVIYVSVWERRRQKWPSKQNETTCLKSLLHMEQALASLLAWEQLCHFGMVQLGTLVPMGPTWGQR